MHEPNLYAASVPHSTATVTAVVNGSQPLPPQPPQPPPRHVAFRLLCHASRVGGLIGKSGSIIKQLQQDTSAKIRIEDSTPNSGHHRLVVVIASPSINKTIKLGKWKDEEKCEEIAVSAAQEALVRVFERIVEVASEVDGVILEVESVVSCRLVVKASQVGSLMGVGGKVIDTIRKENGCKIKVLTSEKLPACASPNDEILEIEGDVVAVKKTLIAVSCRLQDCLHVERTRMTGNTPLELVSEQTFPAQQVDILAQRSSMTTSSVSNASGCHPVSLDAGKISNIDTKLPSKDVVFKILCTSDMVGALIGKGGSIIRALQNDSGATIFVGPAVAGCNERMITVTALENLESQKSPTQIAAFLVFDRLVASGFGMNLGSKPLISVQLVVTSSQVGCLLGKGGTIISEMRRETGTSIRIFRGDQIPKCVSRNDEVVQITGELVNVQGALRNVTGRLRSNLFAAKGSNGAVGRGSAPLVSDINPAGRKGEPCYGFHQSMGVSHGSSQYSALTRSLDNLVVSNHTDHPPSPGLRSLQMQPEVNHRGTFDVSKGSNSVKGSMELGRGSRSAISTSTVEIKVPENVISSVYGDNGSNLDCLRQISGATVTVQEPRPGTADRIVTISGTPDETQAAQSLLQAFMLTG